MFMPLFRRLYLRYWTQSRLVRLRILPKIYLIEIFEHVACCTLDESIHQRLQTNYLWSLFYSVSVKICHTEYDTA